MFLNVFNLYTYMTASESMKIVTSKSPKIIFMKFNVSGRSLRLIYPLFKSTKIMNSSFVYNSSKILNHLLQNDIKYYDLSLSVFKSRLKRHLMFVQSQSLDGDDSWLPCNHDIFSDVRL